MGAKIQVLSVVAFVVIILTSFIVGVHSSDVFRHRRQADEPVTSGKSSPAPVEPPAEPAEPPVIAASLDDNSTTPSAVVNSTMASGREDEGEGSDTVTVTVVIVILLLAVVVGLAVFVYLRIRKRRMADYEKKTQIQMSSTSNAGVYVDLTSISGSEKEKQPDSPETEHLNKEED